MGSNQKTKNRDKTGGGGGDQTSKKESGTKGSAVVAGDQTSIKEFVTMGTTLWKQDKVPERALIMEKRHKTRVYTLQ